MVFYGIRAPHLLTEALPTFLVCPHCGTSGALRTSVFGRYAHIYWIPFAPIGKVIAVECQHCGTVWEGKKIPNELKAAATDVQKRAVRPRSHWAGTALALLLGVGAYGYSTMDDRENKAFLAAPKPGDIYTVHDDSTKMYSLLKVNSTGGNVVELVANGYETDNRQPIKTLNEPSKFTGDTFSITYFDLRIMAQKGQITDVDREEATEK